MNEEIPGQMNIEDTINADALKAARPPVDSNKVIVGRNHPETSHAAARKALPRSGKLKRTVADLIRDGWVRDSGKKELNRFGNEVTLWEWVP